MAHYYKEQKAEKVFEEFKKAFGVDPGDEGPEIQGKISAPEFTVAGILLLEGLILSQDEKASVPTALELLKSQAERFNPDHLKEIQAVWAAIPETKL